MSSEAIRLLQKQVEALQGSIARLSGDTSAPLFGPFANKYLEQKIQNPTLRTATKAAFDNQVRKHLIPAFGARQLDDIKNAEWLRWVTDMREKGKLTRFFNARKSLIELLNAARNDGLIDKLPKLDNPDEFKDVGRTLEEKEILAIIWRSRRPFRFIFYTFWRMGCRPQEILRWEWNMLHWNEPGHTWIEVPARISKTGRQRRIPLNPNVSRRLLIRHRRGNGSPFVFHARGDKARPQLTYNSAWSTACRRARVKAVVYDLRRTFITRCASEGKPLLYVAKALDTSTKMIESTYAKSQSDIMEGIIK